VSARTAARRAAGIGRKSDGLFVRIYRVRWLLLQWARRDFRVRYRQSVLGPAWSVIQPTVLLAFYGVLFVQALHVRPDRGPYVLFAWCGLTTWVLISTSLITGTPSLVISQPLITKVYFPREVVPFAAVLVSAFDLAIATVILVVLTGVTVGLSSSMLALVPIYLSLIMFTAAVTTFAATFAAFARDIQHALPLVLQVAFIATPVMYPSKLVPARFAWVFRFNPIAVLIEQVRTCVIDQRWPPASTLGLDVVVGVLALIVAVAYVRSVEHRLPDFV
jgi:lipopolysaccharide transport system permease protein